MSEPARQQATELERLRARVAELEADHAYLTIRGEFEKRMATEGHNTTSLQWLREGLYLSPVVHREWEATLRKYMSSPQHTGDATWMTSCRRAVP